MELRCTQQSSRVTPQPFAPPDPPMKWWDKELSKSHNLTGDLGGSTTIFVFWKTCVYTVAPRERGVRHSITLLPWEKGLGDEGGRNLQNACLI